MSGSCPGPACSASTGSFGTRESMEKSLPGCPCRWSRKTRLLLITETARLGKSKLCEATLDLFVSIYGAAAGNLALQVMATGGVFIGGGIAPKISWKLKDGTFMKAFTNKGRLSPIVTRIPVKVIMNDQAALLGAAAHAAKRSREG